MTPQDFIKLFVDFHGSVNTEHGRVDFIGQNNTALEKYCETLVLSVKRSGDRRYVSIPDLPYGVFSDLHDWASNSSLKGLKAKISIIKEHNGDILIVDFENSVCTNAGGEVVNDGKVTALIYHYKLQELLNNEVERTSEQLGFIDFYDEFNHEYVLVTNKNQRISIPFPRIIGEAKKYENLKEEIELLNARLAENTSAFRQFLKNALYKKLSEVKEELRFITLVESLESIRQSASVDYNVYHSELSIDEMKMRYQQFRSKFYSDTSDILSKVSSYVIGLPIATLTGAYVIDKSKDSLEVLIIVGSCIFAVSVLSAFIFKHFINDLLSIRKTAEMDFESLTSHEFFKKNIPEKSIFKEIHSRLEEKVESTLMIIRVQFWMMAILTWTLIDYILFIINFNSSQILIFSTCALVFTAIASSLLEKSESESKPETA